MNNAYEYDVEIYPNLFEVTFIPKTADQKLIDVYKAVDIRCLAIKNGKEGNLEELKEAKAKLLLAMGAKQFVIWIDYTTGKWRNDGPLIMDFFIQHKILTGYNSNNYDKIMLDIFINNYKYLDVKGFNKKESKHITQILYDHSCACVDFGKGYSRLLNFKKYYKRPFTDYDIQKILYLDKTYTSLKQVAICLKWYRIQNLPIAYNCKIREKDIYDICDYNVNDVLITLELERSQKAEIELREDISEEFGIDVRNMSRSSIGKAITTSLYEKFSGIDRKDFMDTKTDRWKIKVSSILSPKLKFQTKILNDLLRTVAQSTIVVGSTKDEDKFKHEFQFGDAVYTMALGGLHSQDKPGLLIASEIGACIRDADVASFYPNGILSYDVYPEHLERNPFRATVGYTKDTRVEAKHAASKELKKYKKLLNEINTFKNNHANQSIIDDLQAKADALMQSSKRHKIKAEGLKIAINRMYGAFRDINDYLYDPKCTYKVTINLQLCLLMLIEALELKDIKVISANTDGIVCIIKPEQEADYKACCDWWQEYNNFELEFTNYEKYLRNDVNNYIAVKEGFQDAYDKLIDKTPEAIAELEDIYIKRKGLFIETIAFNKGYAYPVVPKALNLFLLYNVPYADTIENHIHSSKEAIYDYCISQKTDAKFNIIYRSIVNGELHDEELQKSNRFYIADVSYCSGTIIKIDKNKPSKINRIVAKCSVRPFNDYVEEDDYHIDFSYYKKECAKILYGKNKKTAGMVAVQGDLFGAMSNNKHLEPIESPEEDDLFEVDFEDDNISFVNPANDIPINNTIWGMYGFSSEEEYKHAIENGDDLPF